MGFDDGRIVFDRENGTYHAGEIVRGKVVFNQEKNKTFRGMYARFKGFCDVHWTTRKSRTVNKRTEYYTVDHTSHETYIENRIYLIGGPDSEVHLQPGHYEYPFEFMIPPHSPPSFEGTHGHIRYEIKVVIDRSFKFDQEKRVLITVFNPKDLNRDPYCKDPMVFELEETYCCWCMSQGNCTTSASLPQSGYCPGQTVHIELSCANNSSVTMDTIKCEIIESKKYIASHNPGTKSEENVIAKLKKGPIPSSTTRNWVLEMEIPNMDVYNLDACQYIDIRYDFKIVVSPSGCHSDTEDIRRLVIGHIPLREFEGPPQGDQIIAQPAAPSMIFPATNPPHSGANPPYPGANSTYPGANLHYPGANPPYPGANLPYPEANPPYPGANLPYPVGNQSFPGTNPPHPAANPPYPGPNSFPSPMGVSPYPMGNDPAPVQPGFNITHSASPLLPNVTPYPDNHPNVSPYAAPSAPPPGTPDFDKIKSKPVWRNMFKHNLKNETSGLNSMIVQFRCFYFRDVKLKEPLKKITRSLAAGKLPKLGEFTQSKRVIFVSPRSTSDNVCHGSNITMPLRTAPTVPQSLPFGTSAPLPFSVSTPFSCGSNPPPYTETASPCLSSFEEFTPRKLVTNLKEPLSMLDMILAKKSKIENSEALESNSKDMFLLSLLPELNVMDSRQLRVFKCRVMDLIEELLENTPPILTPNDNSNSRDIQSIETIDQESMDGEDHGTKSDIE